MTTPLRRISRGLCRMLEGADSVTVFLLVTVTSQVALRLALSARPEEAIRAAAGGFAIGLILATIHYLWLRGRLGDGGRCD